MSASLLQSLQSQGVPAAVLRPGQQDREKDLRGAQEADGNLGGRLEGEVREAGERSSYLRSALLLGQGEIFH